MSLTIKPSSSQTGRSLRRSAGKIVRLQRNTDRVCLSAPAVYLDNHWKISICISKDSEEVGEEINLALELQGVLTNGTYRVAFEQGHKRYDTVTLSMKRDLGMCNGFQFCISHLARSQPSCSINRKYFSTSPTPKQHPHFTPTPSSISLYFPPAPLQSSLEYSLDPYPASISR